MKQPVLILLKPDCLAKTILGSVINRLQETQLDIIAMRLVKVSREIAENHYQHHKSKPFFEDMIKYILGQYHNKRPLLAIVLFGENSIKKCRDLAGATNPEESSPMSIRGSFGRITTNGIFENVIHVSESYRESKREIKLWLGPGDLISDTFPTKKIIITNFSTRVWA